MEKFVKMTNPNYKVSSTRVLLKCINKSLGSEQLRAWVYEQFAGDIKPQKLKTLKLLKEIRVVADEGQARGFAFIDFMNPERALQFVRKAVERKDDTMSELGNNRGETPIIEFAFDDVKKLRKIEDTKAKQKEEAREQAPEESEDKKSKLEKKQFQRALQANRKLMAKKLVGDALGQKSEEAARQAVESINSLRSRGIKHRLYKKLEKSFSHLLPQSYKQEEEKPKAQKSAERKKKIEKPKKAAAPAEETLLKIKNDVKNKNKKLRREKNNEVDKPDKFETDFIKKTQRKAKWSETA